MDPLTLLTLLAIGLFAVASGFVGVGGSLILVPALVALPASGNMPPKGPAWP